METDSHVHTHTNTAKVVLLSVVMTIIITFAMLYIARDHLIAYLFSELESDFAQMVPVPQAVETNEESVVSAIARVNPAVVSIIVTKDVPVYERYFETFNPWGSLGGFSIPRIRENGTEEREVGGGSGFIVSSDGLLVTNRHVVADDDARYSVVLEDGSVHEVEVVDKDEQLDIAILQITSLPETKLPVVTFGDSRELQLGQTVIAIGNALAEFQNSVSVGVVSGLSRSVVASDSDGVTEILDQVIQTDAAINPGNSGGPLLNLSGEVVGVNVAASRGADNIGFALPAHIVEQVVDSVSEYGEIVRPFLGVRYMMITESVQKDFNLEQNFGALIVDGEADSDVSVQPGSPADRAELQTEDIIIAVDGEFLFEKDLATVLRSKQVGQTVELTILRNGGEQTVQVTLDRAL